MPRKDTTDQIYKIKSLKQAKKKDITSNSNKTDSQHFQEKIKVKDNGMASLKCVLGGERGCTASFINPMKLSSKAKVKIIHFQTKKKKKPRIFFHRNYVSQVIQRKSFFFLNSERKDPQGKTQKFRKQQKPMDRENM